MRWLDDGYFPTNSCLRIPMPSFFGIALGFMMMMDPPVLPRTIKKYSKGSKSSTGFTTSAHTKISSHGWLGISFIPEWLALTKYSSRYVCLDSQIREDRHQS